ncbi:MAG: amidohydrolase family protein [Planctomycetota bacterium]
MIVDLHTLIWETTDQLGDAVAEQLRRRTDVAWDRPTGNAELHAEAMRRVDCAVVHGMELAEIDLHIDAESVAKYVAKHPGKLIGFAGIDPAHGSTVRKLEEAVALGLRGVSIGPAYQGYHPTATKAMALYEFCQDKGLPVFVNLDPKIARPVKMEFGQPYMLDEVARSFPELKLVISSLGAPWVDQAISLLGKHPTVFADISDIVLRPWQLYNALLLAYQQGVLGQVLLGSGFPLCTPERAIVTLYSINTLVQGTHLPPVPREQLRGIVERDALALLGIDFEPTADGPAEAADGEAAGDAEDDELERTLEAAREGAA